MLNTILARRVNHIVAKGGKSCLAKRVKVAWLFHINDSFMLKPANYVDGDILAIDRAYIDYSKFEELAQRGVTYATKMKKTLFRKPFPTRYT